MQLLLTRVQGQGNSNNSMEIQSMEDSQLQQGQQQQLEPHDRNPFVIVPLIHELTTNSTQLAEKRAVGARKFH